ncbi:MAG TPA: hypothetical protein VFE24_08685, partial [Pirellulales bacterium]|nr:hypothetical protein [Pirellulales bacterium]
MSAWSSNSAARARLPSEITAWLDAVGAVLRTSDWAAEIVFHEIDCFDALRNACLIGLLQLLRGDEAAAAEPPLWRRWQNRARGFAYERKRAWSHCRARRRFQPSLDRADVLLWPRLPSDLKNFEPIQRELKNRGLQTQWLASELPVAESLASHGQETAFSATFWSAPMRAARHQGSAAARRLSLDSLTSLPPFGDPAVGARARSALHRLVSDLLPSAYESIACAAAALERLRPAVLVVANDLTLDGRVQARVARRQGIPTICPMHGLVASDSGQGKHVVDRVLLYGEASRRKLLAAGEPEDRLAVTGAPYLNDRASQSGVTDPRIAQFLQLQPGQAWVLVATSGPGHSVSEAHHRTVIRHLARQSAAWPHVKFAVKLHPKDAFHYYQEIARELPDARLRVARAEDALPSDIMTWLQGPAALLTGGSTTGMEAILLDVPVISMDFQKELGQIDYVEAGATLTAASELELETALRQVLEKRDSLADLRIRMKDYLRDTFHHAQGNSAAIAAGVIASLGGFDE